MLRALNDSEWRLRLRPSVAMVPLPGGTYQFFQGNTRRARVYRLRPDLVASLKRMDGEDSLATIAASTGANLRMLCSLAAALHEACIVETADVAARVFESPWRRVLNFLGDYFPSDEVEAAFERIRHTHVVILGVGAVGSWVGVQLAQTGFTKFTLVDPDVIESSNLNRSLYAPSEIGSRKSEALGSRLLRITPGAHVVPNFSLVSNPAQLCEIIESLELQTIVVNCADHPSVDATSSLVDEACQSTGTPYVIAGGYNLHLSLIGMTVIPGKSACYRCSQLGLEDLQGDELVGLRKLFRPRRNIGNLAPLAAITASLAVNEVIRLAVNSHRLRPTMLNRRGEFNFLTHELHFTDLPPRQECGCVERRRS